MVHEVIKVYTFYGAYASFDEKVKGSLEANKLADIIVLNDSILNVERFKIKDLHVELTMIDGEVLFNKSRL